MHHTFDHASITSRNSRKIANFLWDEKNAVKSADNIFRVQIDTHTDTLIIHPLSLSRLQVTVALTRRALHYRHQLLAHGRMGQTLGRVEVETPVYKVVRRHEEGPYPYEVRRYDNRLVEAQVSSADWPESSSGGDKFSNSAFRTLAAYIGVFGSAKNEKAGEPTTIAMTAPVISTKAAEPEPIAMTAPVMSKQDAKGGHETMSFILPATYTMDNAPKPTDPKVKLVERPPQTVAVTTFNWWCDMERGEKEAQGFLAALQEDKVEVTGPWSLARYNPPWTLPWMRTNEIHVPVKESQV
eukprot:m.49358 g.49358  ORF g.49358 m.49358 type:complete len:297 (+) comp7111_c1_seq1:120-1010(+)